MADLWHNDGTSWRLLPAQPYANEATLHDLVEQAPHVLPLSGQPRIAIVGREVQLGSGYADLLAVEPEGRLVIVEIKLARNAEARRAVVAQVLAYAAYLAGLSVEVVEQQLLARHLDQRGYSSLHEAVSNEPGPFYAGLAQNLAEGRFRIVLVLDQIPDELTSIVAYLETLTDRIVIDLIEIESYQVGGSQILVPKLIVAERRWATEIASSAPTRKAPEAQGLGVFSASVEGASEELRPDLQRLQKWAENLEAHGLARPISVQGSGRTVVRVCLLDESVGMVTLWNERGAYLSPQRSVLQRRAPKALEELDKLVTIGNNNSLKPPVLTPEVLDLFTKAYEEAKTNSRRLTTRA